MQVYAFAKIDDKDAREKVYEQIKSGKSRFGMWDQKGDLREHYHGKNGFLLRIREGDWIVHVNSPRYGRCVAVQAKGGYDFDEGIDCKWGTDFCNYIPVDPDTIIEFDRNDPNILPSVNLSPMRRGQRVLRVDDFLKSLENVREARYSENKGELRGILHLREKVKCDLLPKMTTMIHNMNRSKDFERLLKRVFDEMPNVESIQNGFGWRTDHGADLIVEFQNPIIGVSLTSKIIVQAKSYEGDHYDLTAVSQIEEGIAKYNADGGLLITTAEKTEQLEDRVREAFEKTGKVIDIIAGSDVARFIIRYAPELLIGP
ncbi:MAG: restriction endonuclease [Kiritimatiellia bacterium]|jgi:hypothetical protein|nr:restriction endonuclease [Lentisphaerota bacterium]